MSNIAGKTFIITGSNRGIGKIIAEVFLRVGASVVLSGRNAERLEAVRLEFEQMGFSPHAVPADLIRPEECERLVQASLGHFGKIDGLINNAGLPMRGRFEKMSAGLFAEIVNANLLTAVNCTKAALPELIKTQGSVVFISSIAAIVCRASIGGRDNMWRYSYCSSSSEGDWPASGAGRCFSLSRPVLLLGRSPGWFVICFIRLRSY